MRILEENPNCEYAHASFRLMGDRLLADVVERRTRLAPDFRSEKNEIRRSRTGRAIRQPTGVWYITTKERVASTNLERHLLHLLETLEPVKHELLAVVAEQALRADFSCYGCRLPARAARSCRPRHSAG